MRQRFLNHWALIILLISFVGLTTVLIFRLPAFSGPNEGLHYEYVALMNRNGRLPDLSESLRADERHQPPVYYTIATFFSIPLPEPPLDTAFLRNPHYTATFRGNLNPVVHVSLSSAPALYMSRFVSMLFGIIALLAVYLGARLTLTTPIALLIVSVTAFLPTFLHLSATINNDLAVTAMSASLITYTTYLIQRDKGPHAYFFWGVMFALALLTKASAAFLLLLLPLSCWTIWRSQGQRARALLSGLWGAMGFLPFWLIWMLFNQIRSNDALGVAPSVPVWRLFRLLPTDYIALLPHTGTLFRSFWLDWSPGILGYAPLWVYVVAAILLLVGLTGWLKTSNTMIQPIAVVRLHLYWVISLSLAFFAVKSLMIREVGNLVPEGRWLLPIWPSLAWLTGVGWARWWPAEKQSRSVLAAAFIPPIFAFGLIVFLLPTLYPRARSLASQTDIPGQSTPVHLLFDQQLELIAIETEPLIVGEPGRLRLYWQAKQNLFTDYTVSVQLLHNRADEWVRMAGQNSYPGHGLNPTQGWNRGDVYLDQVTLQPEGDLNGPTAALIRISVTDGQNTSLIEQNRSAIDWPIVSEVVVRPSTPLQPPADTFLLEQPVNFGGLIALDGLSYAIEAEALLVTLWWEAHANLHTDYTVFIHAFDENGHLRAQSDAVPGAGSSPTRLWQSGDVVRDRHQLDFVPAAGTELLIGIYETSTLKRLPASQAGQPLSDNVWRLYYP